MLWQAYIIDAIVIIAHSNVKASVYSNTLYCRTCIYVCHVCIACKKNLKSSPPKKKSF